MRKSVLVLGIACLVFVGCKDSEKRQITSEESLEIVDSTVFDENNSQSSLDWAGVYQGTLPCADCEGIKTVLEINEDKTYVLSEIYLGQSEKDNEIMRNGNFDWDVDESKVILKDGDDHIKYKVGENQLMMLNTEGNMIDGKMSDLYILKRNTK